MTSLLTLGSIMPASKRCEILEYTNLLKNLIFQFMYVWKLTAFTKN